MNVAFLIQLLHALPKDSEIKIAHYNNYDTYDSRQYLELSSIEFHPEIKEVQGTNCLRPRKPAYVILS